MPTPVPVGPINQQFVAKGIQRSTDSWLPAHTLFADFNDPAGVPNYYQWKWTEWEKQFFCASCSNALYQTSVEECVPIKYVLGSPPSPPIVYDYECKGDCWEIFYSSTLSLFADTYSDGGPIKKRPVALIPLYDWPVALIEIQQIALTVGAYRYYQLLNEQTQKTGGIAYTPPAPIVGNIHNVNNADERIIGYFSVTSVSRINYWLDRTDASGTMPIPLLEHNPLFEPLSFVDGIKRPPLATCKQSSSRSPYKPVGWR